MSSSSDVVKHGYATIRAMLDDPRGRSIVIGVAAWDAEAQWFEVRTLSPRERVPGITAGVRSFADVAVRQLVRWAERRDVPYAAGPLAPWTSEFWIAASRILTTAIRLDSPRAMAPLRNRELEFDTLFEAVVQPVMPSEGRRKRIDGFVTGALGSSSRLLSRGAEFVAFGGAHESVMRGAAGVAGGVVVEGVNLAGLHARRDADALVSKLLRIREAATVVHIVVGYVSSPGGLNGETDMRDWIREKVTQEVYDLVSEGERFQSAAEEGLARVGLGTA